MLVRGTPGGRPPLVRIERRADEEASFRHLASALTGAVEMTEVLYEITNRATLVTRADGVYVERILNPRVGTWVANSTLEAFRNHQKLRPYYDFMDIDTVRYNVAGEDGEPHEQT